MLMHRSLTALILALVARVLLFVVATRASTQRIFQPDIDKNTATADANWPSLSA